MTPWVKLYSGYWRHRKTLRLKARLGEGADVIPPKLWSYAAENQPDGNFSGYSPEELAQIVEWRGDAQALSQALKECEFIDPDGSIHDWEEHAGFHKTYSDRARKAAAARWQKTPSGENVGEKKRKRRGDKQAYDKHSSSNASSIKAEDGGIQLRSPNDIRLAIEASQAEIKRIESDAASFYYESREQCPGIPQSKRQVKLMKAKAECEIKKLKGHIADLKRRQTGL